MPRLSPRTSRTGFENNVFSVTAPASADEMAFRIVLRKWNWVTAMSLILTGVKAVTADDGECEASVLSRPEFEPVALLSLSHPGRVILRNLAMGSCKAAALAASRDDNLEKILTQQDTLKLLGSQSTVLFPGNSITSSTEECANNSKTHCAARETAELFEALADNPSSSYKTYLRHFASPDLPPAFVSSAREKAGEHCLAQELLSHLPALEDALARIQSEVDILVAAGCPCHISDNLSPTGGTEGGGFNVTVTVQGLDTRSSFIGALSCLFNEQTRVPARIITTNSVMCVAPALSSLSLSSSSMLVSPSETKVGEIQQVLVHVLVGNSTISLSKGGANMLAYHKVPEVDMQRITPHAIPVGDAPLEQRTMTLRGTNFNSRLGGMYLRLASLNSSYTLQDIEVEVTDTSMGSVLMPQVEAAGAFTMQVSLNSYTWYQVGTIEYVLPPTIQSLTPSSGPVRGGILVTLRHARVPLVNSIMLLEAQVGQYATRVTRESETSITLIMPAHTVLGDPGWPIPGTVTISLYTLHANDRYTGAKTRFLFSQPPNTTDQPPNITDAGASFEYACSLEEMRDKICCPAGSAGPGGALGAYCFPCRPGTFAPSAASSSCTACPPQAQSGPESSSCTCDVGYQVDPRTVAACNGDGKRTIF